jgi:membrane associated rhomboid family serine protease
MTPEQIETMAVIQAQQMAEAERRANPEPYEDWKTIPGYLGLPVELDEEKGSRVPWITWTMAALIALISVSAFYSLPSIIQQFGLIPDQAGRYYGATFLTSFFLHGSIWHLVGNLYFLVVFGRGVERDIGPWRWLLLLVVADQLGNLLDITFDPRGSLPTIGASGGISGLLAYYALKFPNARLGIPIRFFVYVQWVDLPAWMCFVIWIGFQTWGAAHQLGGFGDVASLAHLGGSVAGFIFWLLWRTEASRSPAAQVASAQLPVKVR